MSVAISYFYHVHGTSLGPRVQPSQNTCWGGGDNEWLCCFPKNQQTMPCNNFHRWKCLSPQRTQPLAILSLNLTQLLSVCCFPTISAFVICQSSTLRDNSMFALFLQSWNGIFQGLHGTSRFQQIFMLFLHFLFPQPCCFYLNVRQEIGVDLVDFPMKNSSLLLHRLKGMFNKINKSQEQPAKFAGRYGSWWIQGLLRVVLRKPIRIN